MSDFPTKRHRVSEREEFGLMFPRRAPRGRRYSSGTQRATRRRLPLVAAAACVPVLIIAYALTTTHDGRAVDAADVTGAGLQPAASYQGWFEMFPAAPVLFSETVRPGDAMSASVGANGGGSFTLTLTDSTQGWTKVTRQTSDTAQLGSAEIITEAPSDGNGDVLPLSDFGAVTFTDALIDTHAIGTLNMAEVTMESAGNVAEATPSALTDGDEFTVTVDNSSTTGATGTAGATGGHRHRPHHHGSAG
jgi:hypothetical protein